MSALSACPGEENDERGGIDGLLQCSNAEWEGGYVFPYCWGDRCEAGDGIMAGFGNHGGLREKIKSEMVVVLGRTEEVHQRRSILVPRGMHCPSCVSSRQEIYKPLEPEDDRPVYYEFTYCTTIVPSPHWR